MRFLVISIAKCNAGESRIKNTRFTGPYLFRLLAVRYSTRGVPAGLKRQVVISFDQGQVVARSQLGLQEERRSDAAQLAVGNDCDAVAEDVRLIHVVRRQQDGAA